jgi:hypothetical protein
LNCSCLKYKDFISLTCVALPAHEAFGEIEALIQQEGMEVLRQLAQGHLNQGSAEEKKLEALVSVEGESRTHRRADRTRQVESLFGEVEVQRIGYREPGLGILYPLDAELNLSPDRKCT